MCRSGTRQTWFLLLSVDRFLVSNMEMDGFRCVWMLTALDCELSPVWVCTKRSVLSYPRWSHIRRTPLVLGLGPSIWPFDLILISSHLFLPPVHLNSSPAQKWCSIFCTIRHVWHEIDFDWSINRVYPFSGYTIIPIQCRTWVKKDNKTIRQ